MPHTPWTTNVGHAALTALVLTFCFAFLTACSPQIGDACLTSQECGTSGLCDTSSPDGYCTATPCTSNSCSEEAACITFENDQTFCMLRCESSGDCRTNYVCRSDRGPIKFCYVE